MREVNNSSVTSENEDDDEGKNVNGVSPRDSRSVSSTLHDRSRMSGNLSSTSTVGGRTLKEQQQHRSHHRTGSHSNHSNTNPGQAGAGAAKETFLNYFFGTQGPASGPSAAIPSSGIHSQNAHTDILGDEPLPERDMGKVAAFDMKSLGRHIETVSNNRCTECASV